MKLQSPTSAKSHKKLWDALRITGNILLIATLIIFPLFLSSLVAAGWLINAESYGAPFFAYGVWLLIFEGVLLIAVILYFCKLDMAAIIGAVVSYLPMLWITMKAVAIAEENGWVGQTEDSFGRNAFTVWRDGLIGNVIPVVLLLLLAVTRYLSYDAVVKRQQKKERKKAEENRKAPSILGGETK